MPMIFVFRTWQMFAILLAGWVNRQQQEAIDYSRTENDILKERLGKNESCLATISVADWR